MSTRKVKDATLNGEKIYYTGHAKATYMSDGRNVEDAINSVSGGGDIDLSDYATKEEVNAKQDIISDLETIRSGAAKGATALQSDDIMWVKAEGEAGVRLKGTNGTATGNLAISAGDDKTASDGTAYSSAASGDHAVAFGYGNTCAGRSTLAQGLYNIVNGKDAVAFGQRNTVNGDQAFAAGQLNEVATRLGVTIGYKNKATNTNSIAIGYQNTSGGSGSVALGDTCESNGTSSTAMGYKTKATGAYSSTFGENTQATNQGEVAMGAYNKSTNSTDVSQQTSFSIGIGTSDTNRVNALEIKKNGDVYIGDELLNEKMSVWDGKQDKLVSGTNIKTINGTSILGSGNITISGGGSSGGGSGAYVEVNHGTSDTTLTIAPNTFHVWDEVAALDLTFGDETAGVTNEFLFQFTSGATPTTLTLPDSIKWANGNAPSISENKIYQISVLKGLGSVLEFNNVKIITFTFAGKTYQAEEGLSWNDYIVSKYNDGTFYLSDYQISTNYGFLYINGFAVGKIDVIQANGNYYAQQGSGGGN